MAKIDVEAQQDVSTVAEAMLSIFDGDEQPFNGPVLLHIHNGQDVAQ